MWGLSAGKAAEAEIKTEKNAKRVNCPYLLTDWNYTYTARSSCALHIKCGVLSAGDTVEAETEPKNEMR